MTYEEAKDGLEKIKQKMLVHEMGNDMYYSSRQYREDKEDLLFWENKVKEFEQGVSKND